MTPIERVRQELSRAFHGPGGAIPPVQSSPVWPPWGKRHRSCSPPAGMVQFKPYYGPSTPSARLAAPCPSKKSGRCRLTDVDNVRPGTPSPNDTFFEIGGQPIVRRLFPGRRRSIRVLVRPQGRDANCPSSGSNVWSCSTASGRRAPGRPRRAGRAHWVPGNGVPGQTRSSPTASAELLGAGGGNGGVAAQSSRCTTPSGGPSCTAGGKCSRGAECHALHGSSGHPSWSAVRRRGPTGPCPPLRAALVWDRTRAWAWSGWLVSSRGAPETDFYTAPVCPFVGAGRGHSRGCPR